MSQFTWPERPDEAHNHAAPHTPADAGELADGGDALIAPEYAVERTLLTDGAAWRRNITPALPGVDDFVARASQRLASERATTAPPRPSAATRASQPAARAPQRAPTPPLNLPSTNRGPLQKGTYPVTQSRWRGLAGVAAAVIVVGLIGLLLAHSFGGRGVGAKATATPLPTALPGTPTPYAGNGNAVAPILAPSDPQIMYSVQGDIIARSANGGRTYSQGTMPPTTLVGATFVVSVSPLDPNHLIATGTGVGNTASLNCHTPKGQAASVTGHRQQRPLADALSGYGPCSESFFSGDGGKTWRKLNLPYQDVIGSMVPLETTGAGIFAPSHTLFAQGARLYALIGQASVNGILTSGIDPHPVELVVSVDDGASWQVASNGLGSTICDFAPAPTGETVYAVVSSPDCATGPTLWRSNDAGAHWAQVSALSAPYELGMAVAPSGALYINIAVLFTGTPQGTGANPLPHALIVSTDGGATFTHAPAAPITEPSLGPQFAGPLGVLSDGSILIMTVTLESQGDHTTLYAWRAGASAWRKVGTTVARTVVEVVVVPQGGHDALYVVNDAGRVS
ncbi:MAG TPA: sialidase family protein, partial [Ktedonobacterales bacterium]|nr:sialidase family protein [Ktedonobacterales bacterium]